MTRAALLLLASLAAAGCVPPPSPEAPSMLSGSGYSTSVGSSFTTPSLAAPQRGPVRADLVVRPDTIVIEFALRALDADPQKAVAAAQAAAGDLAARLKQATSGAASLKMCGASVSPAATGGKAADDAPEYAVTVDGSIEIHLAPELDYWARSRLIAALAQVTKGVVDAARDTKDRRGASFQQPRVVVKDPEAYRAKLSERWTERARAFAAAAQAGAAPLYVLDCAPPGAIEQSPISLEEIGLSLSVTCRLDALRPEK